MICISIKERKASYSSIKALAEMDLAMRYLCVAALVSTLARGTSEIARGQSASGLARGHGTRNGNRVAYNYEIGLKKTATETQHITRCSTLTNLALTYYCDY